MLSLLPYRRAAKGPFGLRTLPAAHYVVPPMRPIVVAVIIPSMARALGFLQ